jgi:hypothetical protein
MAMKVSPATPTPSIPSFPLGLIKGLTSLNFPALA